MSEPNPGSFANVTRKTPMAGVQGLECWARLLDVHDGDSCRVGVILLDDTARQVVLRLDGIDAPEMNNVQDKPIAMAARDRLVDWASPGLLKGHDAISEALANKIVMIYVRISKADKYGRWLATLHHSTDPKSESANSVLVREGHAMKYSGHGKKPYSKTTG